VLVVTGAAGFLGRHVLEQAAAGGHEVFTVDRRHATNRSTDLVVDLAEPGDRQGELARVLRAAEAVIHLAGRGGVRDDGDDDGAQRRQRDNVIAARTVLRLTPAQRPVVVTSSSSVYGGSRRGRPSDEDDRLRPLGGYAMTKVEVERECARRAARGGRVTVVRPFTVVGRWQRADMALSRWVGQAMAGRALTVFGALHRRRDLTDAADVACAVLRLADTAPQLTVNLGSGTAVSLGTITAAVATRLGDSGVELLAPSPCEPDLSLAGVRRCQELLGFAPRSPDLDDTVAALAADLAGDAPAAPLGARA
jgi:nucleoside-diphosphate-sugar epimerase